VTLEFEFEDNEFFTNKVLTKTYKMTEEFEFESSTGCTIDWKEGKDFTNEKVEVEGSEEGMELRCFFQFFSPPTVEQDEETCLADMDIGFEIKEEILAAAIHFFTGEIYGRCPVHGFLESDFADDEDDEDDFSEGDIQEITSDVE
jgi:nucleosome assembly protein 1-like 1